MERSPKMLIQRSKRFAENHPIVTKLLAGAAINKLASEMVWGGREKTELHTLPYEGSKSVTAGIAFPGMGNTGDGCEDMAKRMSHVLPDQPWAYIKYDNSRKLNIDDIVVLLKKYQKDTGAKYLDIYPESMGTLIAIEAMKKAKIPIRIFAMNSPPFDISDGFGGRLGEIAAKLPDTGVTGKFFGTLIANTIRPGRGEVRANITHAFREAFHGGSPKLFKSQVKILKSIDLENKWEDYKDVINPEHTIAVYISPLEHNDNTVRVGEAFKKYHRFFGRLRVELKRLEMPFAGHADTEAAIRIGEPWLRNAVKSKEHLIFQRGGN